MNKAYWVVAKTRMDLTKQIERKEELKSAFDKICDETGVNDSLSPREVRRMLGLFRALGHSRFLTLFRRGDVPLTTSASDRKTQQERTAPLERTCAPADEGTVEEVVGRTHGCVAAHHKSRTGKSPASGPIA